MFLIVMPKSGLKMLALLCAVVVCLQPSNYCSIMGTFWRSTSLEEEAEPEQQQEHRQLLKDMENEQAGQVCLQSLFNPSSSALAVAVAVMDTLSGAGCVCAGLRL